MVENSSIDARRRADELISALGREVGIATLALDESKSVGLSFNEEAITVTYDEETDGFVLFAIADRLPGPLGPEGMAGLLAFNDELFQESVAHVLYNETTLQVAALFRVDAWSLKADSILPWIDRSLETIGVIRERVWELLGADRRKENDDPEETSFFRI